MPVVKAVVCCRWLFITIYFLSDTYDWYKLFSLLNCTFIKGSSKSKMLDKRKLDLVGRVQLIDQFFRFLEMRLQVPFRQIMEVLFKNETYYKVGHVYFF